MRHTPARLTELAVARYGEAAMKTLELQLTDDVALKAQAVASKRGVTIEQLVRESLDETLARAADLEDAVREVLAENAELYRRLA